MGVGASHGKQKKDEAEEKGNGCNTLGTHFPNTFFLLLLLVVEI